MPKDPYREYGVHFDHPSLWCDVMWKMEQGKDSYLPLPEDARGWFEVGHPGVLIPMVKRLMAAKC